MPSMEYESKPFDCQYVANVLADIWGREHGYKVTIKLTPKCAADCGQSPTNAEEGGEKVERSN